MVNKIALGVKVWRKLIMYERRDSNSHGLPRLLLRQVRLPVSPRSQVCYNDNIYNKNVKFYENIEIC